MTENFGDADDPRRADISTDALFDVFSDAARRTTLFHLRQHGSATLDELVDVLMEVEEYDVGQVDSEDIGRSLREVHLPKLEKHGLVTYDSAEHVIEAAKFPSEVGEWLDLAVRRDIELETEEATEERTLADERRPIRVLLVDDEPGLPETIAAHIEHENDDVETTTAASALQAVTILDEESFDCIVSDYKMPAISGLDFLKVVREEYPSLPFIVFTAKGSEDVASEAIATDVTAYVKKGSSTDQYDELVEHIREAVDRD